MTSHSAIELADLSLEQAARRLRQREISPVELVEASLSRIERWNPLLNAFLAVLNDSARRKALAAERELHRGRWRGPLHGIPISLKDNFLTRGVRTTAGSKILANFVPDRNSAVASRLERAGAILIGKTNMHEFAYGITSENPHYGPVHNPWASDRISGGSSGGSAVSVATGMVFASVGTDTGGSIRIPAALCGIVGLKPTFGAVSCSGVVPLAPSFDHVGPLARNVTDTCIMLEVLLGRFPRSLERPDHRWLSRIRPRRFRLGWPKQYFFENLDPEVQSLVEKAVKHLETLGGRTGEISLARLAGSVTEASNLITSEANYFHESEGFYPARASEYGKDVRGHLQRGYGLRAVDYLRGVAGKREIADDFATAFQKVDVIVAPTSPIAAPRIGESRIRVSAERETTARGELLRLTRPANLAGLPAISVPCGFTDQGLPVGLQLIGPRWSEARLLSIARAYEQTTRWHIRQPRIS